MKKRIFLFVLFLFMFPVIVNAGGSSDDDTGVKDELVTVNCTYHYSEQGRNGAGNTVTYHTYFNFQFNVSDNVHNVDVADYNIKTSINDGALSEYVTIKSTFPKEDVINYNQNVNDIPFNLDAHLNNIMLDYGSSKEELQEAKDNGDFCPSTVYAIHDTSQDKNSVKFIFCDGYNDMWEVDTCQSTSEYINNNKSDLVSNVNKMDLYEALYYDSSAVSGSTMDDQTTIKEDVGREIYETEEEAEDICDEESPNYDPQKCAYIEGVKEEFLENVADNIGGYTEFINELHPLLGEVTCDSIFKDENNNYNSTYYILSNTIKFMQYLSIVLALVLSIVDFVKVVPSQDKALLKKSSTKAATRLIIAIIIFFVPILLDFFLDIMGITNSTCGLL